MILDGKNEESLLETYCKLGSQLNCDKYMIEKIEDKNCSITDKVKNLQTLILTRITFLQNWWIIVDNVVQLSKISPLLPQVGDPMWINGQIIVTIQNTDAVPQDDEFNKHISIRSGMNDKECCQLLNSYTKDENADDQLLKEVSHALDRQPLALAAAGYYVSRVKKVNCLFTWSQYLVKLSCGEQEDMDADFVEFNTVYSKSMLQATLSAVRRNAKISSIFAKVISFFSMISFDPIPRDIIASFVQNIDPSVSFKDICLHLQDCSLFLNSENNDISLHRIVYKAIIVYQSEHSNNEYKMESNVDQTSKALYMFKERDDEIKLMPHLAKFFQILKTKKIKIDLNTLQYLGNVLKKTGKYDKAIEFYEKF
ncbi:uncharacterized protein LOC124449001 [Xenia sp. Carnegie-2017]|uniref:uncharacterized protein LOC124449001 n=1 Tax=Xenia sp. Carnegie-2017 TaxID=2897299 RepID=UPI001F045259|nr:uncharacterized protein LOC124449001 [Xenia sp. Carnegie-2017]